jgi:hypothetical protein
MNAPVVQIAAVTFGTPLEGGFYVGRIRQADGEYALIVAPKAEGEHKDAPLGKLKKVSGAMSFFDGRANTSAFAEAGGKLASWALELSIGGFTDWYLPSRDELELCYRNLKPGKEDNYCWRGDNPSSVPVGYAYFPDSPAQTAGAAFKKGGAESFEEAWYWTSTQSAGDDAYAWCQDFYDGDQSYDHKANYCRARAVRRVKI